MPRKSSTNTRALSTRITNIQREISPYIHLTGGAARGTATSVYIDRKAFGEFSMSNGSKIFTTSDLGGVIPDGGKILGMKVSNVSGRKIQVNIPILSGLIDNDGTTGSNNQTMDRVAYAPLSRFPVIKVHIPDLLASNIDTNASSPQTLFTLSTDGLTDRVYIHFHYKQAI